MLQHKKKTIYRIEIRVCCFYNDKKVYDQCKVLDTIYPTYEEAYSDIEKEKAMRLKNYYFFKSPNEEFDLVCYVDLATKITYLSFRVIEEEVVIKKKPKEEKDFIVEKNVT